MVLYYSWESGGGVRLCNSGKADLGIFLSTIVNNNNFIKFSHIDSMVHLLPAFLSIPQYNKFNPSREKERASMEIDPFLFGSVCGSIFDDKRPRRD